MPLRYQRATVEANGRALAELVQELLSARPATVRELVLIGHDLGGLVCHSAAEALADLPDRRSAMKVISEPHISACRRSASWLGSQRSSTASRRPAR